MTTTELLHPLRREPTRSTHRPHVHSESGAEDRAKDAAWVRPAFAALLLVTAFAYLWDLSASGYANSFYAAAVQAGTKS